ncbi:MAG: single-stranded-DNA-specific exonuclease RecJ [Bacteroidota bacterium]
MKYRWEFRSCDATDTIHRLQRDLNDLPEPLARSLVLRGIETFDQARHYFRPSPEHLHDPFLMQDMDAAADRVLEAIGRQERVLVYGDYDVDGTTATTLMVSFLRMQGLEVTFFIPHRFEHGYGLCEAGFDAAAAFGATLVVALDCGITAVEQAEYAKSKGIDLIICDHHKPKETLPDAVAVLDPKRADCPYPFKELTGCGLGFKLAQAVLQRQAQPMEEAFQYLDLVAISTASDIVPLNGENRVLMREGLRRLQRQPRLGLRTIAEHANVDLSTCATRQIVFTVGPRINAAGRLGSAHLAVDLMLADDPAEADRLAQQLEAMNSERRLIDQETLAEALRQAELQLTSKTRHALVLHQPHWHQGVVGIVASRIVEQFYKPAVMLTSYEGGVKGSARSIEGVSIFQALTECQDLLNAFGGHDYAAGVSLDEAKVPEFRERFDAAVGKRIQPEMLYPIIHIDAKVDVSSIDGRFWSVLKQFAPFGPDNKTPIFMADDLQVVGRPRKVGQDGAHLKFRVRSTAAPQSVPMEVIGYRMRASFNALQESWYRGQPLELLFSVQENHWRGQTTLQLRARDLRLSQNGERPAA